MLGDSSGVSDIVPVITKRCAKSHDHVQTKEAIQ